MGNRVSSPLPAENVKNAIAAVRNSCRSARLQPLVGAPPELASKCVFMTGATNNVRSVAPGIACIASQLRRFHSAIPLVVAVPSDEESSARELLQRSWDALGRRPPNVHIVTWSRIPHEPMLTGT